MLARCLPCEHKFEVEAKEVNTIDIFCPKCEDNMVAIEPKRVIGWRLAKIKYATPERALEIINNFKKEMGWK